MLGPFIVVLIVLALVSPLAFNSSVRLSACRCSLVPETYRPPENLLPPSFGTTLTRTPPVPTDVSAPEMSICVSCCASMFGPVTPR